MIGSSSMSDVRSYFSLGYEEDRETYELLTGFCLEAQKETDNPSLDNIRFDQWESNSSSLLYALYVQGRFSDPSGAFHIVFEESAPVALAGVYRSDFDSTLALVGCRAWTLPAYRARFIIGDLILPEQLEWAQCSGCNLVGMSFNPYNRWLAKMILRASTGKALRFGMTNSEVYRGWTAYPSLCRIRGVDQIVLYRSLDASPVNPNFTSVDTGIPVGSI